MDDVIAFGATGNNDALMKVNLIRQIFNFRCFPLSKWATNSKHLSDLIAANSPEDTKERERLRKSIICSHEESVD